MEVVFSALDVLLLALDVFVVRKFFTVHFVDRAREVLHVFQVDVELGGEVEDAPVLNVLVVDAAFDAVTEAAKDEHCEDDARIHEHVLKLGLGVLSGPEDAFVEGGHLFLGLRVERIKNFLVKRIDLEARKSEAFVSQQLALDDVLALFGVHPHVNHVVGASLRVAHAISARLLHLSSITIFF